MKKCKILVKGPKVDSVGYRAFLLDEAEALLMPNFSARNINNGIEVVEVLVGGTKDNIDIFIKFIKNNYPEDAEVADISFEDYDGDIRTIEAYSRSFSTSQLSKIAVTGVSLLINQKEHIELTKEILHKQDEHNALTKEESNNSLSKQEKHINVTKEGFNSITQELKSFKDVHQEILELRQEITAFRGTVSRIERMVEA